MALDVAQSHLPRPLAIATYVFAIQRWSFSAIQDQEKLFYAAVRLDGTAIPVAEADAETLVMAATVNGCDWLDPAAHLDLRTAAQCANENCFAAADTAYRLFTDDLKAQNADRADIQERALDAHLGHQTATLSAIRAKHLDAGREGLAKATDGRLAALRSRVEQQRLRISERRLVTHSQDEVAVGLIRVVAG